MAGKDRLDVFPDRRRPQHARDGGEGADEPGGADRVAMLSGRIELEEGGILFDWSKTHLDRAVVAGFEELAEAMDFAGMRTKLFGGEVVNPTTALEENLPPQGLAAIERRRSLDAA